MGITLHEPSPQQCAQRLLPHAGARVKANAVKFFPVFLLEKRKKILLKAQKCSCPHTECSLDVMLADGFWL